MTNGWLRAGLIAMLAGWSACAFDADYHRTRYQCDDGACPSGYACRRGYCEPVSGGAQPSGVEECGTTDLAVNDFEDEMVGRTTWQEGGTNIDFQYVEGRLQASTGNPANLAIGAYETRQLYLLRDSRVSVEVPDYEPGTDATLTFDIDVDLATDVSFELNDDELRLTYEVFDNRYVSRKLGYDPVAHRFWQIREEQGTIYWEVSGDGETWELLSTTSSLPFAGLVRIRLVASLPRDAPVVAPVFFDNVNTDVLADGESWCSVAALSDDFNDGLVGSAWRAHVGGSCTFFEKNGALFFDYAAEGVGDCRYESRTFYDLTGSSIAVEVPQVDEASTIHTAFRLKFPGDNEISFVHGEDPMNRLLCKSKLMGAEATPCTLNYVPDEYRWWRFRHDEDTARLHWETSPDGRNWTSQGQYDVSDLILPGAVVHLASASLVAMDRSDVNIHFDNLNIGAD